MRPIVKSVKHIVQFPLDQITTGTIQNIVLIDGVNNTASNLAQEVQEGAEVRAVFVELLLQNTANLGEAIVTLEKTPLSGAGVNFAQSAALFTYVNKKNILYTHQGLTSNDGIGNPQMICNRWFKIPKGKQRFGLGDRLILSIANVSANDLNRCGLAIYKEMS